jgi:hypothetical protein
MLLVQMELVKQRKHLLLFYQCMLRWNELEDAPQH